MVVGTRESSFPVGVTGWRSKVARMGSGLLRPPGRGVWIRRGGWIGGTRGLGGSG